MHYDQLILIIQKTNLFYNIQKGDPTQNLYLNMNNNYPLIMKVQHYTTLHTQLIRHNKSTAQSKHKTVSSYKGQRYKINTHLFGNTWSCESNESQYTIQSR